MSQRIAWLLVGLLAVALGVITTLYVTDDDPPDLTLRETYLCDFLRSEEDECSPGVRSKVRRACRSERVAAVEVTITYPNGPGGQALDRVTTFLCDDYR